MSEHPSGLSIADAIELFLSHRQLKGVSSATLGIYRHWLTVWVEWRAKSNLATQIPAVGIDDLRAFFHYLAKDHIPHQHNTKRPPAKKRGLEPSSSAGCWRVLRAFWRFLADEGALVGDQARYFTGDRIPCPRVPVQVREACDRDSLDALLAACGDRLDDEESVRNRVILLLLYESGMRVSELCRLRDHEIRIGQETALVTGKGNKQRWAFWGPRGTEALLRYLRVRRGPIGGPLIRGVSTRNNGNAMTRDAVRACLKRLAKRAGVKLPAGAPVHWFRHGFAHAALDAGLDVSQLAQLLGHADIETTMRYVREHPGRLRDIHAKIFRTNKNGEEQRSSLGYVAPRRAADQ